MKVRSIKPVLFGLSFVLNQSCLLSKEVHVKKEKSWLVLELLIYIKKINREKRGGIIIVVMMNYMHFYFLFFLLC